MIRFFRLALTLMGLLLVAMLSAITTMHFAIHGAEVKVPDLKGLTLTEASHRALDYGLNLSVDNRFYSADVPADHVIAQSPQPGAVVRREWRVRVTQSLGPQRVSIPDVIGQPERVATLQIRRLGLDLGTIGHLPYAAAAPGTVIAQNPPPDAAGVERPIVSLLLADTPPPAADAVVMPDFTGQLAGGASAAILRSGLKLAPINFVDVAINADDPKPPAAPGTVLSQRPAAGLHIDHGTQVELSVAK